MYIFISSDDSGIIHPNNNSIEFITELARGITMEGVWTCAVVECDIGNHTGDKFIICSDIVENSCVHGGLIPILTIVSNSGTVDHPYYIPVSRDHIYRIRISLLDIKGNIPPTRPQKTRIVLHLKKG